MIKLVYMGSKNRLAKDIVPIIQSYIDKGCSGYLEPFVGGANIIDKIKCENKYGSDLNKYLIALLYHISKNINDLPDEISEEEYHKVKDNKDNCENWYVGLVGFCSTFGAKFFGGYGREKDKNDKLHSIYGTRLNNLTNQAPNLKNIHFKCCSFQELNHVKNYVIYCDPPYRDTTKYATETFPYDEFYDWCREMSKDNIVLVSEYNMPDDFKCIWSKETKANFDSNRESNDDKNIRVEKLWIKN